MLFYACVMQPRHYVIVLTVAQTKQTAFTSQFRSINSPIDCVANAALCWHKVQLHPPLVVLPLSFPPVKAPLKVLAPPASPSGISSRLIRALGRGCLYTWNTWPPSLSSAALLSTKASSNRKTWSRWQTGQTQSKWDLRFYRSHLLFSCDTNISARFYHETRNRSEGVIQWDDTKHILAGVC